MSKDDGFARRQSWCALGYYFSICSRDWGKLWKNSVRMGGNLAENQSTCVLSTTLELYYYIDLLGIFWFSLMCFMVPKRWCGQPSLSSFYVLSWYSWKWLVSVKLTMNNLVPCVSHLWLKYYWYCSHDICEVKRNTSSMQCTIIKFCLIRHILLNKYTGVSNIFM